MIAVLVALGTLWAQPDACGDMLDFATSTDLVGIDGHTIVARALATGDKRKLVDLPADMVGASVVAVTSDRIVVKRRLELNGFDRSGTHRWKQSVGIVAASGDVIASALQRDSDIAVKLIDAETGKERWSTTIDIAGNVESLAVGTKHVYIRIDGTIYARWRDDGTEVWSFKPNATIFRSAADDFLLGGPQGKFFDASTGSATDLGVGAYSGAIHDGHAYVTTAGTNLVSIDLADQQIDWLRDQDGAHVVAATDLGLVVEAREELRLLDPRTGDVMASYALSYPHGLFHVLGVGPLALTCDERTLVAVDPSGHDDIANVTGTMHCKHCTSVTLAGVDATLDANGHFSFDVAGRGVFMLTANHRAITDVRLGGKRSIDLGTLDAP